jgi:hypothetical protein
MAIATDALSRYLADRRSPVQRSDDGAIPKLAGRTGSGVCVERPDRVLWGGQLPGGSVSNAARQTVGATSNEQSEYLSRRYRELRLAPFDIDNNSEQLFYNLCLPHNGIVKPNPG